MMIGEPHHHHYHTSNHPSLTTTSPPSPTSSTHLLSNYDAVLTALSRYLPSNNPDASLPDLSDADDGIPIDAAYAKTDDFRIYDFKVRRCTRAKPHDWTECPFAHPGEKARRRDPRRYTYSGTACTDFRKGSCRRGDSCEFAHGVFECWLHPTRYRTQACKDGLNCARRVCFFAHMPEQLRVLSPRSMGSGFDPFEEGVGVGVETSPPLTPVGRPYGSVKELVVSLRNLQLSKMNSMPNGSAWNAQMGVGSPRIGSTVQAGGFYSLPSTPTWESEREGGMERVESGREVRARMYEKLSKENPLGLSGGVEPGPDVGWVTDLVG